MKNKELLLAVLVILMNLMVVMTLSKGTITGLSFANRTQITADVNLILGDPVQCLVELAPGWNLVSICANVSNRSISSVLDKVRPFVEYVLEWDPDVQGFRAFSFRASNPSFTEFNLSRSYFIYYTNTSNTTLWLGNLPFENVNLSLIQDTQAPAYPYQFSTNISSYINNRSANSLQILLWNFSSQSFVAYSSSSPSLPSIDEGDGQFVVVPESGGANITYIRDALDDYRE